MWLVYSESNPPLLMKASITIPASAYGLHAMFIARGYYDPLKEPEKYKEEYAKAFELLKKKYGTVHNPSCL